MTVNLKEGQRRKEEGINMACKGYELELGLARTIAVTIALGSPDRTTNASQVGTEMEFMGFKLGNWMGALFRTPDWEFTGDYTPNKRAVTHARPVRVWRLKEATND